MADDNAAAWSLPRVVDYFGNHRDRAAEVYPSEWHFLEKLLKPGISVLDVGCAQGGFAAVIGERLEEFTYTGADISGEMIAEARRRFPRHRFVKVPEGDLSPLGEERYDLVLVLGILHLHEKWRDTLAAAWRQTAGTLVFDLRETSGATIEDKEKSHFRMDFNGGGARHAGARLPYIVINTTEATAAIRGICTDAADVSRHGYPHAVSDAAVTPVSIVETTSYAIAR